MNSTAQKYWISFILILFSFCVSLQAQDYKFSQYYNSPLNLNPAFTGKINSLYRIGLNYKMQYFTVQTPSPYTTIAAAADFGLFRDKLQDDIFGIGLSFGNDRQTILKTNKVDLSIAYHKGFGYKKKHYLSAGFQFGFTQRSIDLNNLYFGSQFIGDEFDLSLPNLETFTTNQFIKPNLNIGLLWSSRLSKDKIGVFVGYSMYNITQPKESFLSSEQERFFRQSIHIGSSIQVKKIMIILPNALFAQQKQHLDWNIGSNFAFNLADKKNAFNTSALVGFFYDGNNLLTSNIGIQHTNFMAMISYDANLNKKINKAVKSIGGLEVSLIFTGKPLEKTKIYLPLNCPKF